MAQNTFYGYLIGWDFEDIAGNVIERVEEFIRSREWLCLRVWSVDQSEGDSDGGPEWTLGFNLDLPDPQKEPAGWFADVEALVGFAVQLRNEFQHDIMLGVTDNRSGCAEDIVEVDSDQPDLDYLRRYFGA